MQNDDITIKLISTLCTIQFSISNLVLNLFEKLTGKDIAHTLSHSQIEKARNISKSLFEFLLQNDFADRL